MQLNLGTKIRELRRRDERTQEALAEALGVTSQAVSRWEQGGSYPDMEIIPTIANFFHVSIDELFGYHDDREEKIKGILDNADKIICHQGYIMDKDSMSEDISKCVEMLCAASEEFPNEPTILGRLAKALHILGWKKYGARARTADGAVIIDHDVEYNSQNIYWQKALRVYEKLLKCNPAAEDRETAISQMMQLYCRMGEYEKAKALANAQNSLIICRELLLPMTASGEERARYQGERIIALLSNLQVAISDSVSLNNSVFTSEYGRQVLLSFVNLCETIFIDGRCGFWHWNISYLYFTLADYEATYGGDIKNALAYFDKGFDHCQQYNSIFQEEEYSYSAPLVSNLKVLTKGKIPFIYKDFWKEKIKHLPKNICDEIRKNDKYAECFV